MRKHTFVSFRYFLLYFASIFCAKHIGGVFMKIIERIYVELEKQGRSAADLARAIGVNTAQTSNWKTRKTDPPAKFIPAIAAFLNRSTDYILTGEDVPASKETNFTFAAHNELAHDLTPDQIKQLKTYAEFLRSQN